MPIFSFKKKIKKYYDFSLYCEITFSHQKTEQNFLQGLSLYIDDMHLLKNIYNEFVIYFNRLNITELVYNKMLAIIAYKNLFPRDFADLQLKLKKESEGNRSKGIALAEEICRKYRREGRFFDEILKAGE